MGHKRDYEEVGSPDPEGSSSAPHVHSDRQPMIKKQKPNKKTDKPKTKKGPAEGSSEWKRKRARNIDRLLKKNQELPANVRNDLERELAALKTTASDKVFQKKRSAMISRYHMVRFFERKRAMRLAKALRGRIASSESPEEIEELQRDLHVAEVDEIYTQYFPHAEPYISLYTTTKPDPAKEEEEDKAEVSKTMLRSSRPAIWSEIEKAMEEGDHALKNLRERRSADGSQPEPRPARKHQKSKNAISAANRTAQKPQQQERSKKPAGPSEEKLAGLNRRERRSLMRKVAESAEKVEDEDDGEGFFEDA